MLVWLEVGSVLHVIESTQLKERFALSSNEESDEPAEMRRLAKAFAAQIHKV